MVPEMKPAGQKKDLKNIEPWFWEKIEKYLQ